MCRVIINGYPIYLNQANQNKPNQFIDETSGSTLILKEGLDLEKNRDI